MGSFVWLGGRPTLDLCNTVSGGDDQLREPADIVQWLLEAGYGPPEPDPGPRDLERVRGLRGALRDAFVRRDAEMVGDIVADWLQETPGRLAVDRASLRPNFCPEVSTCRCLLVPALLDALDLARDDIARVRECAAENCAYLYVDTSRNGSRRWCSMERCGSRVKAHNYYARRRAAASSEQPPT